MAVHQVDNVGVQLAISDDRPSYASDVVAAPDFIGRPAIGIGHSLGGLRALTPQAEVETMIGVGHQLMMMRGFDGMIQNDLEAWLDRVA